MKVAGFGFRARASLASLRDALEQAGGPEGVSALATASDKSGADVFKALARTLDLPITAVPEHAIMAAPVTTQSAKSQKMRATGSLSEAAALAAIGTGAKLVVPRCISTDKMATCAIAQGEPE